MRNCRNAIEELVVEEAKAQISRLSTERQKDVSLDEIVAYALNRLPPMYATTQRGWVQQRKRAYNELKKEIAHTVRRAMMGVRYDSLRESSPLPQSELEDQARSLGKLQDLLGRKDLSWKDIPDAVEEALLTVKLKGAVSYTYLSPSKRDAVGIKDYLKRTKKTEYSWKSSRSAAKLPSLSDDKHVIEAKEFASYMFAASYSFKNTLESLVMWIANQNIQRLAPELAQQISLEEVAAFALNRLPPMYATSDRGLKQLRQRAKAEFASQIVAAVREGIQTIIKAPQRALQPLPFAKFINEQEKALIELKDILQIDDLDWRNAPDIVEDALERTLNGELQWQQRSRRHISDIDSSPARSSTSQPDKWG